MQKIEKNVDCILKKKKKDSSNDSTNTEFIGPFSLGVQFKSTWFCVPFSEI